MIRPTADAGGHFKNLATIPLAPCTWFCYCVSVLRIGGFFSDPVFSSQIQDPTTTKKGGKTIACFTVFAAIKLTKLIII
jgi:hypothetical protein